MSHIEESKEATVGIGYPLGQIAAALTTSQEHPDPAVRERAVGKSENWIKVFQGMLSGVLKIGSRAPVVTTPVWATLQVIKGGFATGELLAAGPLQPHEEALLARLSADSALSPRMLLNSYYLTDAGIAELQAMLKSGCYRIRVPEEGALLVIAWLLQQDQAEAARSILHSIAPFLDRLRFYPIAHPRPLPESVLVQLQTIEEGVDNLKRMRVPERVQVQRESTQIWSPLYDRAVDLFLETLEGPVPTLQTEPNGNLVRSATGQFTIEGGWPCQHYPEGWQKRAGLFLEDYQRLRRQHTLSARPDRPGMNFTVLRECLEICLQDPKRLTGREVGRIRAAIAHIVAKRGLPDSERCRALRQFQTAVAACPTRAELAPVLIARLERLPQDEGLESLDEVLSPISAEEAAQYRLAVRPDLAGALADKLRPCLMAPVETLVQQGLIGSGEVLARVTPQITAQIAATGLADPDLRRLYETLYRAFRRRRSLLLLNLEHQVKFRELPWIQAVEPYRDRTGSTQAAARQTLEQIVTLAITAFPEQILPNKLLQEIRALAESAGLALPIVDEVAADIFMGAFSEKFLRAGQVAGTLLMDSLYARYYDISYARVLQIHDVVPSPYGGTSTSPAFFQLCSERAGPAKKSFSVAYNGTIIEQEQILTTHNLAVLFLALGLKETLRPRLTELAQECFQWICRRHQQRIPDWQSRLRMVKNTAYAWRQMLFFLSLESEEAVQAFLPWANAYLQTQSPEFQTRFQPAMAGLSRVLQRLPVEEYHPSIASPLARRFLGWTTEKHWLLATPGKRSDNSP